MIWPNVLLLLVADNYGELTLEYILVDTRSGIDTYYLLVDKPNVFLITRNFYRYDIPHPYSIVNPGVICLRLVRKMKYELGAQALTDYFCLASKQNETGCPLQLESARLGYVSSLMYRW
jgi:hypothetical protein